MVTLFLEDMEDFFTYSVYPNKKALETINVSSAPFYLALNAKQLD